MSEPQLEHPPSVYAAVGIPQGLVQDRERGEIAGAVRRGGELVSLDEPDYRLWSLLLTPMTVAALDTAWQDGSTPRAPIFDRLQGRNLVVAITPAREMNADLRRLRAIPLGVGLGNTNGNPSQFKIQSAALSPASPVSLDPIAIMFWWDLDGATALETAVANVTARLPELTRDAVELAAMRLVHQLMTHRLLFLDAPPSEKDA